MSINSTPPPYGGYGGTVQELDKGSGTGTRTVYIDNPDTPDIDESVTGPDGLPRPPSDALTGASGSSLGGVEDEFSTDLYAFLAIFQQLSQTLKTFAKLEAATALQAQINSLLSAREDMKEAAQKRFAAALTQSIGQIVGGVVQAVSGALALSATLSSGRSEAAQALKEKELGLAKSGAKDGQEVATLKGKLDALEKDIARFKLDAKTQMARGQAYGVGGNGAAQAATGAAGMAAAKESRAAEETEAEKTKKEATAAEYEKAYQAAMEFASTMQEVITATRQLLSEVDRLNHEAFNHTV